MRKHMRIDIDPAEKFEIFRAMLADLGGKYEPMRDLSEPKLHTDGRKRELPIYDITRKINGVKRYEYDQRGQLRRLAA